MLIRMTEKIWRRMAQTAMAALAVVVLLTFRHYGISWDEELQSQYGQAVFDYYASGFSDHRYDQIFNLYLYGGMFDGIAALCDAYSPLSIYETRHLLNAVVGMFGLWGVWRLGRLLGGGLVGFVALALLATTPAYYGHMFNNPKDIPFAVGVVWTLYYMIRALRIFPKVSLAIIFKLGIILGLTLGIRVGGVMLLGYWGLALLAQAVALTHRHASEGWHPIWYAPSRAARTSTGAPATKNGWRRFVAPIPALVVATLPVAALAYAVMLICWPWAQEAPLAHPAEAFIQFSNFPQIVEVLLNGVTYLSTELPWYYVPVYFSIQLPLPQLTLMTFSLLALPWVLRERHGSADKIALLLILVTIGVPVGYATLRHPALYDGIRHFTFTLPLLCIIAGLGVRCGLNRLQRLEGLSLAARRWLALAGGGVAVVVLGLHINTMVRLHPYEYIYINALHGGVKGAFGKYELDYWGSSFKEAAEKLQAHVAAEGGVPAGKIYRVAICGPWSAAMIHLPPDYEAVEADQPADFFLSTTRWMCQDMRDGKEIIHIDRMGARLSVVKDLRG